jgi:hypothetical protein
VTAHNSIKGGKSMGSKKGLKITRIKKGDVTPQIRTKQRQEYLKYMFTREEKEAFSEKLARKIKEAELAELRKKDVVKSLDSDIAKVKTEISDIAGKVQNGYEYRNIDCEVTYNYDTRLKTTVRLDTKEIISDIPMTADELQVPLPLGPVEEKKEETALPKEKPDTSTE